jgi:hypothetical protein
MPKTTAKTVKPVKAAPSAPTPLAGAQNRETSTPARARKTTLKPHEVVVSPSVQSAIVIKSWSNFAGDVDLGELLVDLRKRIANVQDGDMRPVEAMLYGQAKALETLFTSLARRAVSQEYMSNMQTYMGLALKAQAQCRSTLEALAEIKNPRQVSIVKQANISGGHQQVNNTGPDFPAQYAPARARANAGSTQNGLLEASHEVELDTRAPSATGGADRHLEAVVEGHRTTNSGR